MKGRNITSETSWRLFRIFELSDLAWAWCENNGHVRPRKKTINNTTMTLVSTHWKTAKNGVWGRYRKY